MRTIIVLLFALLLAIAIDYEKLIEPGCNPLEVLVKLPISAEAGYKINPTHALVTRCMGVNNENKSCVYKDSTLEIREVDRVQKGTRAKDSIYVSWISHKNCTYHRGRICNFTEAQECHKNGTTHYYDELNCTCDPFVNIHGHISEVRLLHVVTPEVRTVVPFKPTPEGDITTDNQSEDTDNNDLRQFTDTQLPPTTMANSEMSSPPSATEDIHSVIYDATDSTINITSNIITDYPASDITTTNDQLNSDIFVDTTVSNIETTSNIITDVPVSDISTNDQLPSNIMDDDTTNSIGITIDNIYYSSVSDTGADDQLTSSTSNDDITSNIETTNKIIPGTPVSNISPDDYLNNDINNNIGKTDHLNVIPRVKNDPCNCFSSNKFMASVVFVIILLIFLIVLNFYAFCLRTKQNIIPINNNIEEKQNLQSKEVLVQSSAV